MLKGGIYSNALYKFFMVVQKVDISFFLNMPDHDSSIHSYWNQVLWIPSPG